MSRRQRLAKLNTRLTAAQTARRAIRISARQTVADRLSRQSSLQAQVLATHHSVLRRSIGGRLKWLILGK